MIHVMAAAGLGGATMAAPVVGYDTIAVLEEEQHLRIPIIGRERPAVAEHDGLTFAPVLVEDLNAVFGGDRVHRTRSFRTGGGSRNRRRRHCCGGKRGAAAHQKLSARCATFFSSVPSHTKRRINASAVSATSRQPLSITSACPRFFISTISVTPRFFCCCLNEAFAIAQGTVLSFSPEMISTGPRPSFSTSTLASVHGLRLAVAAWKSGTPEAGTAKVLYSSRASSSLTALAKPKRNCSYVSGIARLRFAGLPSTGHADFSAVSGSGSTPRKGPGSIATVAEATPRPESICTSRPPKEWPMTAGFLFSPRMIASKWSATCPTVLCAKTSGFAFASST